MLCIQKYEKRFALRASRSFLLNFWYCFVFAFQYQEKLILQWIYPNEDFNFEENEKFKTQHIFIFLKNRNIWKCHNLSKKKNNLRSFFQPFTNSS